MTFKATTAALLLFLLGCASLPPELADRSEPGKVVFFQRTRKEEDLRLGVLNQALFAAGTQPDKMEKVAEDEAFSQLLEAFLAEGFFAAAVPALPGPVEAYLQVWTGRRSWYLAQPQDDRPWGRLPGEAWKPAIIRFQRCKLIFNRFFNAVEFYHPVINRAGGDYFRRMQEEIERRNRERIRKGHERDG